MKLIPLMVAIPLGTAFFIPMVSRKNQRVPDLLGNLCTFALFLLSLCLIRFVPQVYFMGGWKPPFGITLVLDGLSSFMLILVNLVTFLITLYSISYMELYTSKLRYYSLLLLMLAGMNGVILTGDIFNLFVFLEIAVISAYALTGFGTEAEELEASFKYLVLGSVSSVFILLGIAFIYSLTGSLNLADISQKLAGGRLFQSPALWFAIILFLYGFGMKSAIMPFHPWLPDAHPSAPAPISAMLSGLLIKAAGVYPLLRIFYNMFGMGNLSQKFIPQILMVLGGISMAGGALLALIQTDIKRMFAYSSISHMGYIFLALSLGTPLGILGALFHIFSHAVSKSLLFLTSGSLEYVLHTRDIRKMGGIEERMPITAFSGNIGFLSLAGIPPLAGFWSKLFIILALVKAGRGGWAIFACGVSVLTLGYYLRMNRYVFFGKIKSAFRRVKEAPGTMLGAMLLLSLVVIFLGSFLIPPIRKVLLSPAVHILYSGQEYVKLVLGG